MEFNVGDQVECIAVNDHWVEQAKCRIGDIYTVEKVDSNPSDLSLFINGLWVPPWCFRLIHKGNKMKFKAGDIVIENDEASKAYSQTKTGTKLKVRQPCMDGINFEGEIIDGPYVGIIHTVCNRFFDLVGSNGLVIDPVEEFPKLSYTG